VLQTFEEARGGSLAFVTERIKCSLANALGDRRGTPAAANSRAAAELRELRKLEQYEVSRGVVGVTEALQYVHTISRRVHMNIAPEAIFLAPSGQWKLAGMYRYLLIYLCYTMLCCTSVSVATIGSAGAARTTLQHRSTVGASLYGYSCGWCC
jgi:hypothetical protein